MVGKYYVIVIECYCLLYIFLGLSSVAGRRQLRSADTRILDVPRTCTAIGARNFAVAGPRVWNSLPTELRTLNCSVGTFVQRLKAFLFGCQRV